jgi:hypothetical protein
MVAAYRILVQHEPVPDAVSEMHSFHYNHFFLPQLQRYVVSLPRLAQTNSQFSAYVQAPPSVLTSAPALVGGLTVAPAVQ